MQAWDRDLIASNDMICEWRLDITEMVRDAKITKGPINLQKNYYNDSLKSRISKAGEPEPLTFIEKEKDGNLDNTFYLTAFHAETAVFQSLFNHFSNRNQIILFLLFNNIIVRI